MNLKSTYFANQNYEFDFELAIILVIFHIIQ